MNSIEQLRTQLCTLFTELSTGKVDCAKGKEMNNAAGKIISSAKAQLEYYALRKEAPNIPFLDSSSQPTKEKEPEAK